MELAGPSPLWLAAFGAATAFNIIFPVILAIVLTRRLRESFSIVLYGALIFLAFQLLTRVPLIAVAGQLLASALEQSIALRWGWIAVLAFTAGLAEEIGRYVGYRWLLRKRARTWGQGVLYGVGHGGCEAVVLVGLLGGVFGLSNILVLTRLDPGSLGLTPEQQEVVVEQLRALTEQPWWFPLLSAWERFWSILFHVALSLVVLQVFWQQQVRWLWYAVALHTGVNFVVAGVLPLAGVGPVWVEGVMGLVGLAALWTIAALRRSPPHPTAPGSQV